MPEHEKHTVCLPFLPKNAISLRVLSLAFCLLKPPSQILKPASQLLRLNSHLLRPASWLLKAGLLKIPTILFIKFETEADYEYMPKSTIFNLGLALTSGLAPPSLLPTVTIWRHHIRRWAKALDGIKNVRQQTNKAIYVGERCILYQVLIFFEETRVFAAFGRWTLVHIGPHKFGRLRPYV